SAPGDDDEAPVWCISSPLLRTGAHPDWRAPCVLKRDIRWTIRRPIFAAIAIASFVGGLTDGRFDTAGRHDAVRQWRCALNLGLRGTARDPGCGAVRHAD